jgi:hypothetical protein
VKILNATHNHGPSPIYTHVMHRQNDMETVHEHVDALIHQGLPTRRIMGILRTDEEGGANLLAKDIKNRRQKLHRDLLAGRLPI